jgi:hypothetical protein
MAAIWRRRRLPAMRASHLASHYCNVIEAPWLLNGGHGASLMLAGACALCCLRRQLCFWIRGGFISRCDGHPPQASSTRRADRPTPTPAPRCSEPPVRNVVTCRTLTHTHSLSLSLPPSLSLSLSLSYAHTHTQMDHRHARQAEACVRVRVPHGCCRWREQRRCVAQRQLVDGAHGGAREVPPHDPVPAAEDGAIHLGEPKRLVVESPWSQFASECQRF